MRTLRAASVALAPLVALVITQHAFAFERSPSPAALQAAIAEGKQLALAHRGYSVRDYVVYARADTLSIAPGDGLVDAVVLGTPIERVRYASYIAYFQNHTPSPSDISTAATPNTIDIIVFAHSAGKLDNSFLGHFAGAALKFPGARALQPISQSRFGPTVDFFNVEDKGRQDRWLGYLTYTFNLHSVQAAGTGAAHQRATFVITDPQHRHYALPFVLSNFR